ncbi:MAG: response regulator, partial [Alphaproteobacteria bacterium]
MRTCLIVDDSRVVRKVAGRIARDLGFSCLEAEDGQQAYEACEEAMPDVIILDWNMPIMS